MYDVKHWDDKAHERGTGVSNKLIKENLQKLAEVFPNIVVRVPFYSRVQQFGKRSGGHLSIRPRFTGRQEN